MNAKILLSTLVAVGAMAWGSPEMPKKGVVMELWSNLKGNDLSMVQQTAQKRAADTVTVVGQIDAEDSGVENFGVRYTALLSVPKTGEYTFYLAADDKAELLLSTDATPQQLRPLCKVNRYMPRHRFVPGAGSGKVTLQKGQKYYLELYYKEAANEDHVALAWEGPDIKKTIVPKKAFEPYMTPALRKQWQESEKQAARCRELVQQMGQQKPAALLPWLNKLPKKEQNMLAEAVQKAVVDARNKKTKKIQPYLTAARGVVATPEAPVNHPVAKALLQLENAWLETRSQKELIAMGAHRLAGSLGQIPAQAAPVKAQIKVNSQADKWREELVSIGFYAMPGKPVTVTIPDALAGKKLAMQVGHHFPAKNKPLVCMPNTTGTFPLDKAQTTFVTPHGGLMMLKVPRELALSDTPVTIAGAIRAPRFELGKHTNEDWQKIKKAPAPWGELVSEYAIFVIPRARIDELKNPVELMTWWNANCRDMEDFFAHYPKVPFRMHSGHYAESGISYWPLQWSPEGITGVLTLETMQQRNAPLFLHEHGHHCDFGEMELSFWAEATANWGGYYLKARKGKSFAWKDSHDTHLKRLFDPNDKGMREIMQDKWYKISNKGTHHWSYAITSMMIAYTEDFGWDGMKQVIKRLRDKQGDMYQWPFVQGADKDQAKIDRYLIGLSQAAKRDVRPYFAHFKMFPSEGAAQYMDNLRLPKWDATYLVQPETTTTKKDTPLLIPCTPDKLLSFAKGSKVKWAPQSAQGGTVTPDGGNVRYTPKPGFTGVDVLQYELSNQYGKTVDKELEITVE